MIIDKLIKKIQSTFPVVLGLDTCLDYMPSELTAGVNDFKSAAASILQFNRAILDEVYGIIPAVKLQIAYYEMYGAYGMEAYQATLALAKERGLITIADAKRNDIASTAGAYSKAFLSNAGILGVTGAAFDADFLTVTPYLGSDGIMPFVEDCKKHDKGIFVLVKTSNPSGRELQNKRLEGGKLVYEMMSDYVAEWGSDLVGEFGYSSVGAVVGATMPVEAESLRKRHKGMFFLIPGYGAQGATAKDLKVSFDQNGSGGIVNNSRGILTAHKKYTDIPYAAAAKKALKVMRQDFAEQGLGC